MTIKDKQTVNFTDWDFNKIQIWEKILSSELVQNNIAETTLDLATTYTYRYNFIGLLSNELGIDPEVWYIHLRINGLESPLDFNGNNKIKVLNPDVAETIIKKIQAMESE